MEKQILLLLKKYISHVLQCEGVDFISQCNQSYGSDEYFSDKEVKILESLSEYDESMKEYEILEIALQKLLSKE